MKKTLHLELTTRCILECPACARTFFSKKLNRPVPKIDLDTDLLNKFLDCDSGRQIEKFHFESNHGDAIYLPGFIEFLQHWRGSKTFNIVTNGSRMKLDFWNKLASVLTEKESITFSIDGLEDTNPLYRINSDWSSIIAGLDIMVKHGVPVTWKTVIFSHNQHQLKDIETFAYQHGASKFELVKSHRFGDESMQPDQSYVLVERLYQNSKDSPVTSPQCDQGSQLYISSDGYCWPCCWITSYYTLHTTQLWKDRSKWTIQHQTLDDLLAINQIWADAIKQYPKSSHSICKMMCKD